MVLRLLMKSVTGKQGASILCTTPDLQAPRTLIFPRSALCRQGQGRRNKIMSPGHSAPATPLSVAQQPILHPRFSNRDLRWGPKCQSSFPLPSPVTVWAVIRSSSLYGHPWAAQVLAGRWRWIHTRIWMEAGRASLSPPFLCHGLKLGQSFWITRDLELVYKLASRAQPQFSLICALYLFWWQGLSPCRWIYC